MKTEHSLVTPLCRRLGLDVPIVQAPMAGGWTTPQLVASACAAGALGCIAASRLPLDELRAQIRFVRSQTSRLFAVNVQIAPTRNAGTATTVRTDEVLNAIRDELRLEHRSSAALSATQSFEDEIGVALELRAPILSLALGDPQPYVAAAHSAGALVIAAVTSVAEAVHAEAAGVDAIVAQGSEAGGHRSTFLHDLNDPPLIGTMALVPQIVDAVSIPVIASGGIADGRGLLAALALKRRRSARDSFSRRKAVRRRRIASGSRARTRRIRPSPISSPDVRLERFAMRSIPVCATAEPGIWAGREREPRLRTSRNMDASGTIPTGSRS